MPPAKEAKAAVSAFIMKLETVVNDPSTDDIITWKRNPDGSLYEPNCLVVLDKTRFSEDIMPQYFRGSKYCSFIRQLNAYDFSHVGVVNGTDPPMFTHPYFQKDNPSLLHKIERRKQDKRTRATAPQEDTKVVKKVDSSQSACVDYYKENLVHAVTAIRDMVQAAELAGMGYVLVEYAKTFLATQGIIVLSDDDVLYHLETLTKTSASYATTTPSSNEVPPTPASNASTESVSSGSSSPLSVHPAHGIDPLAALLPSHHNPLPPLSHHDPLTALDFAILDEINVDELGDLLTDHL
ncbi:hypothetical protein SPRG_19264 [Saprolegnia parasitica CBS 223.65]|uniref:HSF-type DNA-binding domain-containing protein n=1 Tax=Saprolegnia parasitica (strain CBS 223.65) TaxID=695850 RepID=A0A067D3R8_SAPPC|nr:hypothetical protein SPRG_19264 [Saprolegnia parasitica CBS 223.65]KDO33647.1 hypothetical protein SPRG_19264 [Saprolegnia parasitica CBS 223.65]|eukprot:XP_012195681.1 hypothetical protein SPRG_19264 [Saprolegnia parasitica CBS 223.65]